MAQRLTVAQLAEKFEASEARQTELLDMVKHLASSLARPEAPAAPAKPERKPRKPRKAAAKPEPAAEAKPPAKRQSRKERAKALAAESGEAIVARKRRMPIPGEAVNEEGLKEALKRAKLSGLTLAKAKKFEKIVQAIFDEDGLSGGAAAKELRRLQEQHFGDFALAKSWVHIQAIVEKALGLRAVSTDHDTVKVDGREVRWLAMKSPKRGSDSRALLLALGFGPKFVKGEGWKWLDLVWRGGVWGASTGQHAFGVSAEI